MKKTLFTMLMIASCFGVANAQLTVDGNGWVGIGTSGTLASPFSVNGVGNNNVTGYMYATRPTALDITHYPMTLYINNYGIRCENYLVADYTNYGIYSNVNGPTSYNAKSIGVYGGAQGSSGGYNYGVYGYVSSNHNGAGVFGTTYNTGFPGIMGKYAGFFYGDVFMTGALTVGYINQTSDYRLKDNIRSLTNSDGCLGKIMDMNVVEYNYKQREFTTNVTEQDRIDEANREADLIARGMKPEEIAARKEERNQRAFWHEDDSPMLRNKHYGLIAQELQDIYPNLVDEGQDGYLAINYTEIIPLLIRSIQELNAKLEQYENGGDPVYKAQTRTADAEATAIDAIVTTLYQNTPNPFTESTLIRCDVADDVVKADLYIYNMNGEQIAEYAVTERGETGITIDGGSLNAGMYLYALIADGQVIDTKRMILTK